jgi:hypothetical protein
MNYVPAIESPANMLRSGRSGFSREADYIDKEKKSLIDRLLETFSFGERERKIISLFNSSLSECVHDNWDGYNALPVSLMTYIKALIFLLTLPASVKLPDISSDPDGSVSMEWYRSPEWLFSLSIDADGKLDYAAIFGDKKHHGTMYFIDGIDRDILNFIGRV